MTIAVSDLKSQAPVGRLPLLISLALRDARIQEIYAQLNPEKLDYLRKQLTARGTAPAGDAIDSRAC